VNDALQRRASLEPGAPEIAFAAFLRLVACLCLFFGVLYWQIAASTLAVLFPFAAAGLWMLASWGPVIWFLCAAGEISMYAGFPQYFGYRPTVVAVHAAVAVIYCAFRVFIHLSKRKAVTP
jgi:hypothetical protein